MGGTTTMSGPDGTDDLLRRIGQGEECALVELFARHRERLKRMVKLRLDRRLQGRVDPSDVIQEAHLEVARRAREYLNTPTLPPFLWLRFLTGQQILQAHRRHLGAQLRDAGQEISLHRGALPLATSVSLAALLLGRLTSPTRAAQRAELRLRLQEVLNQMDPIDREVLVLRHFEELSNGETARVLGLEKSAASNRYVRALKRLKDVLSTMPGFFE
jgi:RNA polymerase sigma-70 factor (ECF subfamily)